MNIVGANPAARAVGVSPRSGISNYFIGNYPTQWHTNIASFGRVEYDDVYPGIDLAYYGKNQQLEYDFVVSAGADPSAIALNFAGADGLEINAQGDLVVHTAVGDVVQRKPFTYQDIGNVSQEVASGYVIHGDSVRFEIGRYDPHLPLVIDPVVLGYSTFLGGIGRDEGYGIAIDGSGNSYVTGESSLSFPTTPGAFDTTYNGNADVFVTKLNAAGSALVYSTYLGGSEVDFGQSIAVDITGVAYLTGETRSSNFPATAGAFDTTYNGGFSDVFVAKLNTAGSALTYSTYLGGVDGDTGVALALDANGNAYVTGETGSIDFPTTGGAFDTTYNGDFDDVFVTKLNMAASALAYSTFLGGGGSDVGNGIAVDGTGSAYVTGYTASTDFPTMPGAFDTTHNSGTYDAFVTKLNASGSALTYSTFLGGFSLERGFAIAVDLSGFAYVTGNTGSGNFPTTPAHLIRHITAESTTRS